MSQHWGFSHPWGADLYWVSILGIAMNAHTCREPWILRAVKSIQQPYYTSTLYHCSISIVSHLTSTLSSRSVKSNFKSLWYHSRPRFNPIPAFRCSVKLSRRHHPFSIIGVIMTQVAPSNDSKMHFSWIYTVQYIVGVISSNVFLTSWTAASSGTGAPSVTN